MRTRRSAVLTLVAAAALILPAGSTVAQSPAVSPDLPPGTPAASFEVGDRRLADAVAATVAADTVRTAFQVVFSGSSAIPDGTTLSGSGQTNLGIERRMRLDLDMSALGAGMFDIIVDGSTLYIRGLPFGDIPADRWVMADLTSDSPMVDTLRGLASGNNDASLLLYFLLGATGPAEVVGEETIDGVPVTRLRTTVDLERAAALVPEAMRRTIADNIAEVREGGVEPVLGADAWVAADGLVHRVSFAYTLGELMGGGGMEVTFDFRQHGEALDLGVPAPDEVVDIETLS